MKMTGCWDNGDSGKNNQFVVALVCDVERFA